MKTTDQPTADCAHTPGPWTPGQLDRNFNAWLCSQSEVVAKLTFANDKAAKANLNLAAAAPDLLEALQEVFDDGLATNMKRWRKKAEAAIAKAGGNA